MKHTAVVTGELDSTIACHECDLLISLPELEHGQTASCPRCNHLLTRRFLGAHNKILALSISAFIFLIFSLAFPFLSFTSQGKEFVISFSDTILSMVLMDYFSIAVLMLFSTLFIPGLCLLALIYVLISLQKKQLLPYTHQVLHLIFILVNWNMAEIFLVAVLVSFIKVSSLATVTLGLSFWSYVFFIFCLVASLSLLDRYQIWRKVKLHER
jgi:paraquat-inducible protein A